MATSPATQLFRTFSSQPSLQRASRSASRSASRHPGRGPRFLAFLAGLLLGGLALTGQALVPLSGAAQVTGGAFHTCARTTSGAVKCWGSNAEGQLGDGSTTMRTTPVDVVGLSSGVGTIATGWYHSCAINAGGGLKCWGLNANGQLGDGSMTDRTAPVDVVGIGSAVSAVVAGWYHSCALTTGGGVKCWGGNSSGQLGDGSLDIRTTVVDVVGLGSGVTKLAAGPFHTCALTTGGGVKCWGGNSSGQLGDGSALPRPAPVDVVGLASGVSALAAGWYHTCAVTTGGGAKCWGGNSDGQLGTGNTMLFQTPVDVAGLASGVSGITAGISHSCAQLATGGIKCWGRNSGGQLGDGTIAQRLAPVDVSGLATGVIATGAGGYHSCAVTSGGGVRCWGSNFDGQLGDGSTSYRVAPVDALGLGSGVASVATGWFHTCARTTGGAVKCWGDNSEGQLGDGSTTYRATAVDVAGLGSGASSVAAGERHSCAVSAGGAVKCWGNNADGQLGDGTDIDRPTPVDVTGLGSGASAVAAGLFHSCALTVRGGVKCWGDNAYGQLGDATTTSSPLPVTVTGLASGVSAVVAGAYHTCALTTAGGVKCWGYNYDGELGDGTTALRPAPVNVTGLGSGITAIAAGSYHNCVLPAAGGVKCWGANAGGQLGDGSTTKRLAPVDVAGLSGGMSALGAALYHSCVATAGGAVKCWGYNSDGELGDGSTTDHLAPVDVVGLGSGVIALAARDRHSCALTAGAGVKCWGDSSFGQVGDGVRQLTPVTVLAIGAPTVTTDTASSLAMTTATLNGTVSSNGAGATTSFQYGATTSYGSTAAGSPATLAADAANAAVTAAITGLACGATYHFRAVASNSAGTSFGADRSFATSACPGPTITRSPDALNFGGQSLNTTSPSQAVTITNAGASPVVIASVATTSPFTVTHDCGTLAAGASCTAAVVFTPSAQGAAAGTLAITSGSGSPTVALAGTGERSLVTHYYQSILRRAPDGGGKVYWEGIAVTLPTWGASINETWYAMAMYFYASPEYLAFNRDNAGFVTDLYRTFFNRPPDSGGLNYWVGVLSRGMAREVVLAGFMFSSEFVTFTEAIFGSTAARPEVNVVMDFYRGLLARLPEKTGFDNWLAQIRSAQCIGPSAVSSVVDRISQDFLVGEEYQRRVRTNKQYVGDLYNAFLRRGGEEAGVAHWVNRLDSGLSTREDERQDFLRSPEFQSRVQAVIDAGCLMP